MRSIQEGQKFGAWTVLAPYPGGTHTWRCRCDCGKKSAVWGRKLLSGQSKHCGRCRRNSPAIVEQIECIMRIVASECGVTVEDMRGSSRQRPLVRYRHFAMWLAKQQTQASYPAIAGVFGARNHTTAMHAVRAMSKLVRTDREWMAIAADFTGLLGRQAA